MSTNEERREVAARLRMYLPYAIKHDTDEHIDARIHGNAMFRNIAQAVGGDISNLIDTYEETLIKLIDLIEPEPERICHKELMTEEHDVEYFGCSWCGEYLSGTDCYGLDDGPNYCSNCGHKVDKSIVTDESTGEVIYRDGTKVVEE